MLLLILLHSLYSQSFPHFPTTFSVAYSRKVCFTSCGGSCTRLGGNDIALSSSKSRVKVVVRVTVTGPQILQFARSFSYPRFSAVRRESRDIRSALARSRIRLRYVASFRIPAFAPGLVLRLYCLDGITIGCFATVSVPGKWDFHAK